MQKIGMASGWAEGRGWRTTNDERKKGGRKEGGNEREGRRDWDGSREGRKKWGRGEREGKWKEGKGEAGWIREWSRMKGREGRGEVGWKEGRYCRQGERKGGEERGRMKRTSLGRKERRSTRDCTCLKICTSVKTPPISQVGPVQVCNLEDRDIPLFPKLTQFQVCHIAVQNLIQSAFR